MWCYRLCLRKFVFGIGLNVMGGVGVKLSDVYSCWVVMNLGSMLMYMCV